MGDLVFVNVQMEPDLREMLEKMAAQDQRSRSGMVRWLIISEWDRRMDNPENAESIRIENTTD